MHAALLPGSRAIILLDEAIKLGLHNLETMALTIGESAIKVLVDSLPLLAQANTVVQDKIHFFFVLGPWRSPVISSVGPRSIEMTYVPLPKLLRTACQS
jgi:hypothetical protein